MSALARVGAASKEGLSCQGFGVISISTSSGRQQQMDARTPKVSAARTAMQRYVDQEIVAGVSWAVLRGREVVDQQCVGFADREAKTALRPDHIFRAYSNTKIFVTSAIML